MKNKRSASQVNDIETKPVKLDPFIKEVFQQDANSNRRMNYFEASMMIQAADVELSLECFNGFFGWKVFDLRVKSDIRGSKEVLKIHNKKQSDWKRLELIQTKRKTRRKSVQAINLAQGQKRAKADSTSALPD